MMGGATQQAASIVAPAIAAHAVSRRFGSTDVLRNVSMAIPAGEFRALVGRNGAGKSTLVSILTGMLAPTSGNVTFGGVDAPPLSDRPAWLQRVSCVYQRWTVIPTLSVAENICLNNQPRTRWGAIDWAELNKRAGEILSDWDIDIDPTLPAWRMSVEQRQIVEIARALLQGSKLIVLDEPTAELERREVTRLFDRLRGLRENGITFLYISHHLEEIYELCDSVTVLRDGEKVAEDWVRDLSKERLVQAMVGDHDGAPRAKSVFQVAPDRTPVLSVRHVSLGAEVSDVSFDVHAGECVGLAGLAGSGKDEIGEMVAGLRQPAAGEIAIDGTVVQLRSVMAARKAGVGYVPRDRHERGLLPQLSIGENVTISISDRLGKAGFVPPARQTDRALSLMRDFGIVASSPAQPIRELSGGNQQKGLFARALASDPRLLVLVAPTQGVDIASKDMLFASIHEAQKRGLAVLVISDELDELSICSTVHVVFQGRLTNTFGDDREDRVLVSAIEGLGSVGQ